MLKSAKDSPRRCPPLGGADGPRPVRHSFNSPVVFLWVRGLASQPVGFDSPNLPDSPGKLQSSAIEAVKFNRGETP